MQGLTTGRTPRWPKRSRPRCAPAAARWISTFTTPRPCLLQLRLTRRVGFGPVVHGLATDENQLLAQRPELGQHGLGVGVAKRVHAQALGQALAEIQANAELTRVHKGVFALQLLACLRTRGQVALVLITRKLFFSRALRGVESRCRHTPRITQPGGARVAGRAYIRISLGAHGVAAHRCWAPKSPNPPTSLAAHQPSTRRIPAGA
jgi:hypothetical protein